MVKFIKNPELFRMIRQGMAGMIVLCAAFASAALAQEGQTGVSYRVLMNPQEPTYQVAFRHMESMYKKDNYHWNGTEWFRYPVIGIGDTYLNNDDYSEVIAYAMDDAERPTVFCQEDGKCPHFILEVRDDGVRELARIYAHTIARDDKNNDGYWGLRVYTKDPDVDPYYYETYVYDGKKDKYFPAPK